MGKLAVGSKGGESITECVEVTLELRAVPCFVRIQPTTAGEEPVARVAEKGEESPYEVITSERRKRVCANVVYSTRSWVPCVNDK